MGNKGIFGERHPSVAIDLNNLAFAWYKLGDLRKAIEHLEQAYDMFKEFYGDEHPHTRDAQRWLYGLKGKWLIRTWLDWLRGKLLGGK